MALQTGEMQAYIEAIKGRARTAACPGSMR